MFNVTQIIINKGLTLLGAGAASTIIDGGKASLGAKSGMLYVDHVTAPVLVEGFTLQNAGDGGGGEIASITVSHGTAAVTIQNNHFIGVADGTNPFDNGLWSYSTNGLLTIQDNEFEAMWQALLLELPRGGATVQGNNFHNLAPQTDSGTVYEPQGVTAMTYLGETVSNPVQIKANSFSAYNGLGINFYGGYSGSGVGQFTNVQITGNTDTAIGSGPERFHVGIRLVNPNGTGATGGVPNALVSGNVLTGPGGTDSKGIWLAGPNNGVTVQCNRIAGLNQGIAAEEYTSGAGVPAGLVATSNSIAGNTVGIDNSTNPNSIDAENNWWGCVTGPNTGTCDTTVGVVDFSPWATSVPTCVNCAADADCDDGLACNGGETCNTGTSMCQSEAPVSCPGQCFTGLCLEPTGTCEPKSSGSTCNTGVDTCSLLDTCDGAGTCENTGGGGDPDGDHICSADDNCPTVANPDQSDVDGNSIGDLCDSNFAPTALILRRTELMGHTSTRADNGTILVLGSMNVNPPYNGAADAILTNGLTAHVTGAGGVNETIDLTTSGGAICTPGSTRWGPKVKCLVKVGRRTVASLRLEPNKYRLIPNVYDVTIRAVHRSFAPSLTNAPVEVAVLTSLHDYRDKIGESGGCQTKIHNRRSVCSEQGIAP
jgi:hypothetical protein